MTRKIAIVIESLGGGGAQHVVTTLANAWADRGIDVTAVTFQEQSTDVFQLLPSVHRLVLGGTGDSANVFAGILANIRRIVRLREALKTSGASHVVSFVGTTNILTVLATFGLRLRVVVCERNDPALQSLGRVWDVLRRLTYPRASLVVANSRMALATMTKYVSRDRLLWLPNPLRRPADHTMPSASSPSGDPVFISVGRLAAQKAYDILLVAFAQVQKTIPGSQLTILGDGPLRAALIQQAEDLGISASVTFLGYVDDPFPQYRSATMLVHPARYEGMPNAVLEAMSVSLPVIVTNSQKGLLEFVKDGESGLVVDVESSSELADAMTRLATDRSLRHHLGERARDAVMPFQADKAIAAWTSALSLEN